MRSVLKSRSLRSLLVFLTLAGALIAKPQRAAAAGPEFCAYQCATWCPRDWNWWCQQAFGGTCGIGATCGINTMYCGPFMISIVCYGYIE